jgi:hypothetical protein
MCGPSAAEEGLSGQESSLSSLLSANYAQNFGAQSAVLQNLSNIFTPIAEAGPDQQGFGANELAALNTQANQGVGQNYAKAKQALAVSQSAQGGGNEVLPSGAQQEQQESLAASAANQMSNEDLAITNANYTTGRQNWQSATAGLNALAGQYNPTAYAGQAISGNNSAFGEANQINNQQNQEEADIIGGVTSLGMDAATFGAGALAGDQGFDFQGGLSALTGKG